MKGKFGKMKKTGAVTLFIVFVLLMVLLIAIVIFVRESLVMELNGRHL